MKNIDALLKENAPIARERIMEGLPSDENLVQYERSPEFEQRAKRALDRSKRRTLPGWLRNAAAAAVICFIMGGIVISPAAANIYEELHRLITVHIMGREVEEKFVAASFGYLPSAMEQVSVTEQAENSIVISFRALDGRWFSLNQYRLSSDGYLTMEIPAGGTSETVTLNGIEYLILSDWNGISVSWSQDGFEFFLTGNLNREVSLKIAQGVVVNP